ncbi:EF-hand domain-containing protein [Zwartia hollandica]|uniref:EF-hand domain-containing protein n=1 Tax=Zwartia hollandica TaxID=324606 RepID=UPI0040570F29
MKMRLALASLVVLMGISLGAASVAQTMTTSQANEVKQAEERFAAADKNADGKLTLEEAKAGMPRIASSFSKIDVEKKGYVTLDQIKAMILKK